MYTNKKTITYNRPCWYIDSHMVQTVGNFNFFSPFFLFFVSFSKARSVYTNFYWTIMIKERFNVYN